jgi:hypothetical protein
MTMRGTLTITIGLGLLQATSAPLPALLPTFAQIVSIAGGLTALAVVIYRLGVWRQDIANAKQSLGADVVRHREETGRSLEQLERRLAQLDQLLVATGERRVTAERWQARIETKLEGQERELRDTADRVERLETRGA